MEKSKESSKKEREAFMKRKLVLPAIALGFLGLAIFHVVQAQQTQSKVEPVTPPAVAPFPHTISGAGLVEPETENISIGSHLPGVAVEVAVKVGQKVKAGDLLFRLDDRQLTAEMKVREANLTAAKASLERLEQMPRPEDIPASDARIREAQANLTEKEDKAKRARNLSGRGALSEEEVFQAQQMFQVAREQLERVKAENRLLKAGAWEPEKAVARATVQQMQSQLDQTRIELERLRVKASVDGEVLQVNVRPGEFVGAPPGQTLILLGSVAKLHVRIDVDEHDIPRFRPGVRAVATVRGSTSDKMPLTFVKVEPYVVPKKSLTGDNRERVDTRVLQVIYSLETSARQVYVGQQLDVYFDSAGK
jgi:multidrug resistance efflux pump